MTNLRLRHIYTLIAAAIIAVTAGSCADNDLDFGQSTAGTAQILLNLQYNTFDDSNLASRAAAGNTISDIDDVCVVAFGVDAQLVSCQYFTKATGLTVGASANRPTDPAYDPDVIRSATVSISLPYGKYHIYAVANMGHPDIWLGSISTEREFRNIRFGWDNTEMSRNSQMCGFVTDKPGTVVANREPQLLTIGRTSSQLHSWLKRAVSKVTVAYDATQLNDNVFIYITSARVADIPMTCTMVNENVPQATDGSDVLSPAQCLTQGESINYLRTDGDPTSSRVQLSKGYSYGGLNKVPELQPGTNVHLPDEESLFFFENMQGTHPNKHIYNNFDSKDNVTYGSYLEVEAYYLNRNATSATGGKIIYRYMLGMNDTDDFNAMRNTHFKVTLRFIGDANNPDWHIEYGHSDVPEVQIPSPLYISYLYNQSIEIPLNCYFDDDKYFVKSIDAEILDNAYTYPTHKYHALDVPVSIGGRTYRWSDPKYGFVSFLDLTDKTYIDVSDDNNYLGHVAYDTFDGAQYDKKTKNWTFSIPIYSRPLNLLVPDADGSLSYLGFSGDNNHVNQHRHANVRVTVRFGSTTDALYESSVDTDIEIIQVNRIVNPRGVWRPADSMEPFTVVIMNATADPTNVSSITESSVNFTNLLSYGPWTARVYTETHGDAHFKPGVDWIELSPEGKNQWCRGPDATVTGSTHTEVRFDIRPTTRLPQGAPPRFGVVEVMYHNNQCRHLIFVSQGYGSVEIGDNHWMMGNLFANGMEVENPVMEGSMFKYGNVNYALRARNNFNLDSNGQERDAGPFKDTSEVDIWWADRPFSAGAFGKLTEAIKSRFGPVSADLINGFNAQSLKYSANDGGTYRMAEYDDFNQLLDAERFGITYGIIYGAEVTCTRSSSPDRYTTAGDRSGMRGCFVYDRENGNHMFLPIGATGNGRRKVYYESPTGLRYGALKYSEIDAELPYAEAIKSPILYDVYRKAGALYWYKNYQETDGKINYGFDINYYTLQAKHNQTQMLYYYGKSTDSRLRRFAPGKYSKPSAEWADQNSDAAFIRRIRVSQ